MRSAIAVLLAGFLLSGPAHAYLKAGPAGYGHWLQGAIAPLDGGGAFATPAAAYSMRKLKSTYTGPAIRLRRASDNAEADINFLSFTGFTGAPIDTAAAAAHCAATNCFITRIYDQSGNARDLVQTTVAYQPGYLANCIGTLPCARLTSGTMALSTAVAFTPSAILSLNAVSRRTASPNNCVIANVGSNTLYIDPTPNWYLAGATGSMAIVGAADTWVSGAGIINGAASVISTNGTENTGPATGGGAAGVIQFWSTLSTGSFDETEMIFWDNYALTASERVALTNNQRSFWGF